MTTETKTPTDAELLEFMAEFVGWTELGHPLNKPEMLWGYSPHHDRCHKRAVLDYLSSVDLWLRDVWPKISEDRQLEARWFAYVLNPFAIIAHAINATARDRCLALYRALDGKLPDTKGTP